ncbi:histidine phosphatase family protein [Tissierella pigra]|uniref:Histidine phosphatase family protein n=1 Tax=Tissierella pigra TaxID=2607614 RepID=A0A6N7XJQ2_9FIRM|nr:histidine phosphatase family protein [Tissierella pigra]MSU01002.1 histidine phosphatase family protein [Tissierella pigra]
MTIYFVRHGKEEEGFRGGWSQIGLSNEGKRQAKLLAEYLYRNKERFNITRIISSDLNRAKETAFYIAKKFEMKVELNQEWREHNNGIMAGMSNEEAETSFPGLYFNTLGMDERYLEGESPREFLNRIEKTFYNLVDEVSAQNEDILVVTHGGVINIIYHLVKEIEWTNKNKVFKAQNTSIHKSEVDKGKIKMTLSKYIDHLN